MTPVVVVPLVFVHENHDLILGRSCLSANFLHINFRRQWHICAHLEIFWTGSFDLYRICGNWMAMDKSVALRRFTA